MLNVGHAILEIKGDASPRAPSFVVENENFLLRWFKLRRVRPFFFCVSFNCRERRRKGGEVFLSRGWIGWIGLLEIILVIAYRGGELYVLVSVIILVFFVH